MTPEREAARRANRRGAGPAVAVSLAIHLVLILAAGFIVPKPRFIGTPDEPPVNVMLIPPLPQMRIHHPPPRPKPETAARSAPLPRVHQAQNPQPDVAASPVPAAPGPATPQGLPPGTSIAPGPLPADDHPHGVEALLRRTVGCDYATAHLTPEEKAACAQRFAEIARGASNHDFVPDDKRGAYSLEAAANARRRDAHDQNVPMTEPLQSCSGPGSNFSVGCIPESAMSHMRSH